VGHRRLGGPERAVRETQAPPGSCAGRFWFPRGLAIPARALAKPPSRPRWRSYNAYNPGMREIPKNRPSFSGPVDEIPQKRRLYLFDS
jgi:hypothetical protein